jgi:DNA-binding transcriptional LysR family regulator
MSNDGLEAFLAVARLLNVSRAAEQLHLAQSTVSKRLKDLELELGITLFERGKGLKFIHLTSEGEEFLDIAQRWLVLRNQALGLKSQNSKLSLRIGSLSTLDYALFQPLYRSLCQPQPPLRLNITTSHSWNLYDLLERRQIDVGFTLLERSYPNILVEKFYSEPMVVLRIFSKQYPSSKIFHPNELDANHELFLSAGSSYEIWHNKWWNPLNSNCIK